MYWFHSVSKFYLGCSCCWQWRLIQIALNLHFKLTLAAVLFCSAPHDDDIMEWNAVIFGPDDTPWEGATFKLKMSFTEEYPNKPPKVQFVTKCFHPNVYASGAICLDILQNQWSPIYDIAAILTSIQVMLFPLWFFESSLMLIVSLVLL
jgi:hypothetical protein